MGHRLRGTEGLDDGAGGPATLVGQSASKAWSNLNGTGTIAERDSFNVSGYVDNGTGDYTFTISSDMSDANYALQMSSQQGSSLTTGGLDAASSSGSPTSKTSGEHRMQVFAESGSANDNADVNTLVMGDLA